MGYNRDVRIVAMFIIIWLEGKKKSCPKPNHESILEEWSFTFTLS